MSATVTGQPLMNPDWEHVDKYINKYIKFTYWELNRKGDVRKRRFQMLEHSVNFLLGPGWSDTSDNKVEGHLSCIDFFSCLRHWAAATGHKVEEPDMDDPCESRDIDRYVRYIFMFDVIRFSRLPKLVGFYVEEAKSFKNDPLGVAMFVVKNWEMLRSIRSDFAEVMSPLPVMLSVMVQAMEGIAANVDILKELKGLGSVYLYEILQKMKETLSDCKGDDRDSVGDLRVHFSTLVKECAGGIKNVDEIDAGLQSRAITDYLLAAIGGWTGLERDTDKGATLTMINEMNELSARLDYANGQIARLMPSVQRGGDDEVSITEYGRNSEVDMRSLFEQIGLVNVEVTGNSYEGYEKYLHNAKIISRNLDDAGFSCYWSKDEYHSYIEFKFKTQRIIPMKYTIESGPFHPKGPHLRSWSLWGSPDEKRNWIELSNRKDYEGLNHSKAMAEIECDLFNEKYVAVRYLRLTQNDRNCGNSLHLCLANFSVYGKLEDKV